MDETIRQLEREIAKTGDPHSILELDRNLRRTSGALTYYTAALIKEFWKNFSLETFFAPHGSQPRTFFVDLPDCDSTVHNDIGVGVFVQPGNSDGWYPTLVLTWRSRSYFGVRSSTLCSLTNLYNWKYKEWLPTAKPPELEINTCIGKSFSQLWNWEAKSHVCSSLMTTDPKNWIPLDESS